MDTTPDRLSSQNLKKKASETFKEYAKRWQNFTTQVQPTHWEGDDGVFVNNLYTLYYKKLVGNAIKIFTNMVISDEMIKNVMKNDNINAKENK